MACRQARRSLVVGLYDRQGVLRFVGSTTQACLDYAELFEIPLAPCSLQSLPEPGVIRIRSRRRLGVHSN
ncbi:MAG: hypothetical protein CL862_08965 [Cyanobium sp. NAT70]|nr:hypothetical protein [Cyanobium sp. NAT70]